MERQRYQELKHSRHKCLLQQQQQKEASAASTIQRGQLPSYTIRMSVHYPSFLSYLLQVAPLRIEYVPCCCNCHNVCEKVLNATTPFIQTFHQCGNLSMLVTPSSLSTTAVRCWLARKKVKRLRSEKERRQIARKKQMTISK